MTGRTDGVVEKVPGGKIGGSSDGPVEVETGSSGLVGGLPLFFLDGKFGMTEIGGAVLVYDVETTRVLASSKMNQSSLREALINVNNRS